MKSAASNTPAYQPLYRQIKDLITEALVSGEWRPGEPIPSEIELTQRFSVSQGTVRKAISELAEQNLLVRHQGKGTFVASHSEERKNFPFLRITPDHGTLLSLSATLIDFWRIKLDAAAAHRLGLADAARAFLIRRLLATGGEPVIYEEIRLPAAVFDGLSTETIDRYHCMLYSMYEGAFQIRILHVEERLKAASAEGEIAARLDVEEGTPLLIIDRVAYTYADKPVELRRSYCHTGEHHYRNRIV
ncbi:MAG TPA: GntR family transcriptional regulator [Burkholderiales bacterium]|nr:GntR family transcriptional regulator [Burkholderiales bacterium]